MFDIIAIKEMHIAHTKRYSYTAIKMAKVRHSEITKGRLGVEKLDFSHSAGGDTHVSSHCVKSECFILN
jgi:hypothetical protein